VATLIEPLTQLQAIDVLTPFPVTCKLKHYKILFVMHQPKLNSFRMTMRAWQFANAYLQVILLWSLNNFIVVTTRGGRSQARSHSLTHLSQHVSWIWFGWVNLWCNISWPYNLWILDLCCWIQERWRFITVVEILWQPHKLWSYEPCFIDSVCMSYCA